MVLCVSECQPVGFSSLGSNPGYLEIKMFKSIVFLIFLIALATAEDVHGRCERYSKAFAEALEGHAQSEEERNFVVNEEYSSAMAYCRKHGLCETPCYREIFTCLDAQRIFDFVIPKLNECCKKCHGIKT
uniref:Uncharacterized protein n=1 Tax=Bursaphelenchus xylophilus TaxID=6326 RepID=A0A1I7S5E6_BURXY